MQNALRTRSLTAAAALTAAATLTASTALADVLSVRGPTPDYATVHLQGAFVGTENYFGSSSWTVVLDWAW